MGLLREQYAEWKQAPLPYCCNQVWMKNGGQVPWNVTPICETSQIYNLMGRLHTKDVLGNHWRTDHPIRFIGSVWPYFPERPVKNPSIWKDSFTWIVPRIRSVPGTNVEGWRTPFVSVLRAENFGDLITADHKVLSDNSESRNNHRHAVVVQDLATQCIHLFPCETNTSQETQKSLQQFLEPNRKPEVIYTCNSLEFGKACEDLSWYQWTSKHVNQKLMRLFWEHYAECKKTLLPHWYRCLVWWEDTIRKTFWRTFFKGPIIPSCSLVEYDPISPKDQSRIHQLETKVLLELFLGRVLHAGRIWKGDIMVADLEELETMDASEIYSRRLNAQRWYFPKKQENLFFQPQMDESILLEEIKNWEHPLMWEHPIRG